MTDFEFVTMVLVGVFIAFHALWTVADSIEDAAQRGERIYNARNRDHDSVPPIAWRDEP